MTDKVIPSLNRYYSSSVEGAIHDIGTATWVVPDGDREVEDPDGDLATGTLGGFTIEDQASDGSSVDFDGGEAFVRGRWLARDIQTTVDGLSPSDGDELVVGFDPDASDTVEIDKPSNLSSDHYAVLAEFNGVISPAQWKDARSTTPREDTVEPTYHASQHAPGGDDPLSGYPEADSDRVLAWATETDISVSAASSADWDSTASASGSTNLSPSMDSAPDAAVATIVDSDPGTVVQITGGDATSVSWKIINYSTSSRTVDVHFLALGPR